MNFYKRLNRWQKILFWFVTIALSLVVAFSSYAVHWIYNRTMELYKAKFELAYDTAGDFSMLHVTGVGRTTLYNAGFDRGGIVQGPISWFLNSYYEDVHKKVPSTDCEYYYANFLYKHYPFIWMPHKNDLRYLADEIPVNAQKIYDLSCKSQPMERFFRINAYSGYLLLFSLYNSQIPLSDNEKIGVMDMLIKNATDLINKTEPQDYINYPKIHIKRPSDYILLLAMLYDMIRLNADLSKRSICDAEIRQSLKFIEEKRKISIHLFRESRVISEDYIQGDERDTGEMIRTTNLKLNQCQ